MATDRTGLRRRRTVTLAVVYICLLSVAHAKTHINPTATQKPHLDRDGRGSVQKEAESHFPHRKPLRNRPQNAQATLTGAKRVEFESCVANTAVRSTAVLATPDVWP